jgi:hypothetical protein
MCLGISVEGFYCYYFLIDMATVNYWVSFLFRKPLLHQTHFRQVLVRTQ